MYMFFPPISFSILDYFACLYNNLGQSYYSFCPFLLIFNFFSLLHSRSALAKTRNKFYLSIYNITSYLCVC